MADGGIPRTALVTGGARRLGRAIALGLAQAGYAIVLHCRAGDPDAPGTQAEIERLGVRCQVLAADLGCEAETAGVMARVTLGPVGVLVNNASVFEPGEWDDTDRANWDAHLEPNLRAPFVLTQAFARGLPADRQGVVINMLDQRVWSLTPHFVAYTVSKAALWALTRQLALALAPRIRVNAIGPGPALPSSRQTEAQFAAQSARLPLGVGTTPAEIARAVLMMLELPALTGQMWALDGGQHLQWGAPPARPMEE